MCPSAMALHRKGSACSVAGCEALECTKHGTCGGMPINNADPAYDCSLGIKADTDGHLAYAHAE